MRDGPRFFGLLGEAWLCIGAHPLRTFLAMLGIVIGVASVVLLMAIGEGSRRAVEDAVKSLGSNVLIVVPGGRVSGSAGLRPTRFEIRDAADIAQLPLVEAAAAASYPLALPASAGKASARVQVTAATPAFFWIRDWTFAAGEPFTGDDVRLGTRVAVVGRTVVEGLFGGDDPLGRTLLIKGTPFQIVGVLKRKGPGLDGRDQDDAVIVPITTGESHLWGQQAFAGVAQLVYVKAASAGALDGAVENVRGFLRRRFRLPESAGDTFTIQNITSAMQVAVDTTQAFSTLLGAIASISLLVGGIGIMNIMLVNVAERVREIGVRKAVGATGRQILGQFLLEAVLITGVGSLIGLGVGLGGGWAAEYFLSIGVAFNLSMVVLAMGVATLAGVASGFYPAYKAARMQPIEALRSLGG